MRKFSEELDRMVRKRSITIYELAKISGVERTLIHKMLKGERVPAKPSVVDALANALMLSAEEKETLLESYRAAKMGEEVYRSRQAVLDFYNQFPPTVPALPLFHRGMPRFVEKRESPVSYGRGWKRRPPGPAGVSEFSRSRSAPHRLNFWPLLRPGERI